MRRATPWLVGVSMAVLVAPLLIAGPGSGTLFGSNPTQLIIVDPVTGTSSLVGSFSNAFPALAVDPTTGLLYGGDTSSSMQLFRINTSTAGATLVGGTGLTGRGINDMDFNASGVLYASVNRFTSSSGGDTLITIDKSTGAGTIIGTFGTCVGPPPGGSCSIDGMEAIAFDGAGQLWGATRGTSALYRINTSTGAATFVANILDGSATPPVRGVVALRFACNGTLFGATRGNLGGDLSSDDGETAALATGDFGPLQAVGARLITINTTTGVFAFSGAGTANPTGPVAALAFAAGCGCGHHVVHGHISTLPATHSGTSAQHHGTHGHTVAAGADCPPHAPGHSVLSPEPGEGFFATVSAAAQPLPTFVAGNNEDGSQNAPDRPARRGAVLSLYGLTNGFFLDDQDRAIASVFTPAAGSLYHTTSLPEVRVGGAPAQVLFSGLAPGLTGVWQINIIVLAEAPSGTVPVTVIYEGEELRSVHVSLRAEP